MNERWSGNEREAFMAAFIVDGEAGMEGEQITSRENNTHANYR